MESLNTTTCKKCIDAKMPAPELDVFVVDLGKSCKADCDIHGEFHILLNDGGEEQVFADDDLMLGEVEDIADNELSVAEKSAALRAAIHDAEGTGRSHRNHLAKHLLTAIYAHRATEANAPEPNGSDTDAIMEARAENAAEDAQAA